MLNWAARYFPILRVLKQRLTRTDSLLEIGSGPFGIGKFYHAPFVGCDIYFPVRPRAPMQPVLTSATNLPFGDRSFNAVVVSDVLEHVPPDERAVLIREALRVTRKIAIFGFPCGPQALTYDRKLAETYDHLGRDKPVWLQEHMLHPFPTEALFEDVQPEWIVSSFGNESLDFHYWVMRREMRRYWTYGFTVLLVLMPRLVERALRRADREPFYRRIVVVQQRCAPDSVASEL